MTGGEPECMPIFAAPMVIARVSNPSRMADMEIHFLRKLKPWFRVRLSSHYPFITIKDSADEELAMTVLEEER